MNGYCIVLILGIILFLLGCLIGRAIFIIDSNDDENFALPIIMVVLGIFLVGFGGGSITGSTHAYKKAVYNNPYTAKITYSIGKDSTLVPVDTTYMLKTK